MLHPRFIKRKGHEVLKPQRHIHKIRAERDLNVLARGGLQRLTLGAAAMHNLGHYFYIFTHFGKMAVLD